MAKLFSHEFDGNEHQPMLYSCPHLYQNIVFYRLQSEYETETYLT